MTVCFCFAARSFIPSKFAPCGASEKMALAFAPFLFLVTFFYSTVWSAKKHFEGLRQKTSFILEGISKAKSR